MGDPVSPKRQGSYRREEYQQARPHESLSMGGLIQNCAAALENECANLEREIKEKTSAQDELKPKTSRQIENISKQRAELEHLKALTHKEIMNRESFLAKNSNLREKSEVLQGYFSSWCKSINLLLLSKEQLTEFLNKMLIQEENEQKVLSEIGEQYENALVDADLSIHNLETLRDGEQSEFSEIKAHFRAQLGMQEEQESELMGNLRELEGNIREKVTMVNMLAPQNAELKKTLEKVNLAKTAAVSKVESTTSQLQTVLQNELERKEKLTENIDALDKIIYETNNNIIDTEEKIKKFDSKQKQLITQEEEFSKTEENEMENLKQLQSKVELMKKELCTLVKIDEENCTLQLECEKMEEAAENAKLKIKEIENIEKSYASDLEQIEKCIKETEEKKSTILNERQVIEENIRELENVMNDDKRQHELLSAEIDEPYLELTDKYESLNKSLNSFSEQLKLTTEDKVKFEETIQKLNVELDTSIAIYKESDSKLNNQNEEFSRIYDDFKGQESDLDDKIARLVEDYNKAQNDTLLSEEIKLNIKELEADLENEKVSFQSEVETLQESHKCQIQAKIQEMADLRNHSEREFRNKEQSKTDVVVELKENRDRITFLSNQKSLTESEIQKTQSNVVKCDSLVRKLESKLKRVALVATAESHSQASAIHQYQPKQSINLLDVDITQNSSRDIIKHSKIPSPSGSLSSGMTFDPDSVDLMKVKRKIAPLNKLQRANKKKKTLEDNKQKVVDSYDDWGW